MAVDEADLIAHHIAMQSVVVQLLIAVTNLSEHPAELANLLKLKAQDSIQIGSIEAPGHNAAAIRNRAATYIEMLFAGIIEPGHHGPKLA